MSRADRIAELRAHWPTLLGIVLAFAWITWRYGVDLAAAMLFLLICIGAVWQHVQKMQTLVIATAEIAKATAQVVAAQAAEAHTKKLDTTDGPRERTH